MLNFTVTRYSVTDCDQMLQRYKPKSHTIALKVTATPWLLDTLRRYRLEHAAELCAVARLGSNMYSFWIQILILPGVLEHIKSSQKVLQTRSIEQTSN